MDILEFTLLAATALLTMINPLGVMALFTGLTAGMSRPVVVGIATRSAAYALAILIGFALIGQTIFDFFDISVESLRIVGGIIFFLMGYEMLQARLSRLEIDDPDLRTAYQDDFSLSPLAVPMIAGPGSIATVILFINEEPSLEYRAALFGVIALVCGLTWVSMLGAARVSALIGEQGNKVIMRIMGLIVMMIAVEFFFAGLTPKVQQMLSVGAGI